MTVYIDNARNRLGRMKMCHMIADNLDELHKMAEAIGMRRSWFQDKGIPHYDVCLMRRKKAIELGAIEVTSKQLVRIGRDIGDAKDEK